MLKSPQGANKESFFCNLPLKSPKNVCLKFVLWNILTKLLYYCLLKYSIGYLNKTLTYFILKVEDICLDYMTRAANGGDVSSALYLASAYDTGLNLGVERKVYIFTMGLFFFCFFLCLII
jgi:hypothetical protein